MSEPAQGVVPERLALEAAEAIRRAPACRVGACSPEQWHSRRAVLQGPYLAVLALTLRGRPRLVWAVSEYPAIGLAPCPPALAAAKALAWLECRTLAQVECSAEWCGGLPRTILALPGRGGPKGKRVRA